MGTHKGRNIIVTGAASGIGLAVSRKLAVLGTNLALVDKNSEGLKEHLSEIEKVAEETGFKIQVKSFTVDVTDAAAVSDCVHKAATSFGRLDGLAHCAGINPVCPVTSEVPLDLFQSIISINLGGTFHFTQALIQQFLKQNKNGDSPPEGGYSIVNAGSTASVTGIQNSSAYCAAKHGILGLSRSAAKEYAKEGIRVNVVGPGPIDTPLLRNLGVTDDHAQAIVPMARFGGAPEVANLFAFLLGPESSYITGGIQMIDGGWTS